MEVFFINSKRFFKSKKEAQLYMKNLGACKSDFAIVPVHADVIDITKTRS